LLTAMSVMCSGLRPARSAAAEMRSPTLAMLSRMEVAGVIGPSKCGSDRGILNSAAIPDR